MAELFGNYEINRAPRFGARILRILAGSILFHAFLIAFVMYGSSAFSAWRLASMFSGIEYAEDEPSGMTRRERVQWIAVADEDGKFHYPAGYFNRAETPPAREVYEERAPRPTPTPTPRPTPTPAPQPSAYVSPSTIAGAQSNANANTNQPTMSEAQSEEILDRQAAQSNVRRPPRVDGAPFRRLLVQAKEMIDRGELDLNRTIELTIDADRNDDGTLRNIRLSGAAGGDARMRALAEDFVNALSTSRALAFLEGVRHVRMNVRADQQNVTARVASNMESEEVARERASGYGLLLVAARFTQRGEQAAIWNSTTVSSNGSQLTLQFRMTRETVTAMLARQVS